MALGGDCCQLSWITLGTNHAKNVVVHSDAGTDDKNDEEPFASRHVEKFLVT